MSTDLAKNSGYDGGKKISGIKRHMVVDINGLPQAIHINRANVSDREGALLCSVYLIKCLTQFNVS